MSGEYPSTATHRTAPEQTTRMPGGIPYIIGNEAAERFSFYGMRGILMTFMTMHLMANGVKSVMTKEDATVWFHTFVWAVYLTPLLGAIVADRWLGKYKTILLLSIVYCLGHLALAIDETRVGLFTGLALIAIGSGGIKGCVSAHVGDQFGQQNAHLLPRVYQWFYFSINLGSALSFILIPPLLKSHGPGVAFGIPGIFMAIATVVFWMGRHRFAHIPPAGPGYWKKTFSPENLACVRRMAVLFVFIAVFWSLFDQTSSRWVAQAAHMDRTLFGWEISAEQLQSFNPVFVMLLLPFCAFIVYPAISRIFALTPLRKIGLGLFFAVPSFLIPAFCEMSIQDGGTPSILWQILAYFFITLAEVMISPVALEFSYTQAPKEGKSLMLGLNMLSVSLGNAFTALVNLFGAGSLPGAKYYLFFSALMLLAAAIYVPFARRFRDRTILQDSAA